MTDGLTTMSAIQQAEAQLKAAMLTSDVTQLDQLLADNLIFTNHLGQLMTKADDLDAHRAGAVQIDQLELADWRIQVLSETTAIASVQAQIQGTFNGAAATGQFRFTRVWHQSDAGHWQVAAAHASLLS